MRCLQGLAAALRMGSAWQEATVWDSSWLCCSMLAWAAVACEDLNHLQSPACMLVPDRGRGLHISRKVYSCSAAAGRAVYAALPSSALVI